MIVWFTGSAGSTGSSIWMSSLCDFDAASTLVTKDYNVNLVDLVKDSKHGLFYTLSNSANPS